MRICNAPNFLALVLLIPCLCAAQEMAEREIEIHKNVRLILMAIPQETPKEFRDRYQHFLPLFEEALKENTSNLASENALTIRVGLGIKEIGAAKTKRVMARVTAYERGSRTEFTGGFLLYSYATGENVSKAEIEQFLRRQILGPLNLS